jgi:hypothetical protein
MQPARFMRRSSLSFALFLFAAVFVAAQVVAPVEIKDPALRALQTQYMDDLKEVGADILSENFDFPFYLSRRLDLDQDKQKTSDQRSIRFDHFNGKVVIAITGNYYAAYSTEKMNGEQRSRETFVHVVMPLLKATVPRFQTNKSVQGYAFEVSHHVMGKVMSVSMERPENLVVFLPQASAIKLLAAKDDDAKQAALLGGQVFLNAEPVSIWLSGEAPKTAVAPPPPAEVDEPPDAPTKVGAEVMHDSDGSASADGPVPTFPKSAKPREAPAPAQPPRDTSPQAMAALDVANKAVVAKMTKELDAQAHFVPYVSPDFVVFRQGIYLELSLNTTLPETAAGSRYKLAAFAFDEHIAHLIRPALAYFKEDPKFDGIGFSTTPHLPGKVATAGAAEAVEFFFPFSALRCYEKYDCTGQQLIDSGAVLINGERISLDLQTAEAGPLW